MTTVPTTTTSPETPGGGIDLAGPGLETLNQYLRQQQQAKQVFIGQRNEGGMKSGN